MIVLVLALDTSTPTVTAGVVRVRRPHEILPDLPAGAGAGPVPTDVGVFAPNVPEVTLAERTVTDPFGHAEHLMPLVDAALTDAGHALGEMDAVVVGAGPGPFTGLRVGMATAAALGDALDVPVYPVPSHDAMARRAAWAGDFLVVTDARRREVYLTAFEESAARVHGPVVIAPAAVPGLLTTQRLAPEWITGAGAGLLAEALGLPVREPTGPLSQHLVDCAAGPLLTGAVPGPLTPLYLRRPDATAPSAPKPVLPQSESTGAGR